MPPGGRVAPEELVGPSRPGRKLVYPGTPDQPAVIEVARGADLLVHEATFAGEERERANETGHTTAARPPGWRGGRGSPTGADPHQRPIQREPPRSWRGEGGVRETIIARDGMTVDVPFAD